MLYCSRSITILRWKDLILEISHHFYSNTLQYFNLVIFEVSSNGLAQVAISRFYTSLSVGPAMSQCLLSSKCSYPFFHICELNDGFECVIN